MGYNINLTINFLKEQFDKSKYMSENPESKKYRLEHTMRVANIGKVIAENEGLDVEALTIGCLLHDISYINAFNIEEDWLNHGRNAAKIARPFLETLQLSENQINEICYGIAIHVDDKSDFSGEPTALAVSIGDCDNIDRFDVFRIYENLENKLFSQLPYHEQMEYILKYIDGLNRLKNMKMATNTAKKMWTDKINFQIQFYERMKAQFESSNNIINN